MSQIVQTSKEKRQHINLKNPYSFDFFIIFLFSVQYMEENKL